MTMQHQLTLPDMKRRKQNPPTGEELKRQGIEKVLARERERTKKRALEVLNDFIGRWPKLFNADEIAMAWEENGITFHHPNVAGGIIREALKSGVMVRTGEYVPSTRASRRGSMVPVYRSVRGGDAA